MAILLKATSPIEQRIQTVRPANGRTFTLEELQAFVGGDIQIVRTNYPKRWDVMNQDGKRLGLPINELATGGYHAAGGMPWDVIVGDVLSATRFELGLGVDHRAIRRTFKVVKTAKGSTIE